MVENLLSKVYLGPGVYRGPPDVYRGPPEVYRGSPEVYRGPCMKITPLNQTITYTNSVKALKATRAVQQFIEIDSSTGCGEERLKQLVGQKRVGQITQIFLEQRGDVMDAVIGRQMNADAAVKLLP